MAPAGHRQLRQLWYVPLLGLAMSLMLARALALAAVLDVPEFAKFSGGLLVSATFSMLGCFGVQVLLQREWPVAIVRGRELRGLVLAAQCQWIALLVAVIGASAAALGAGAPGVEPSWLALGVLHGWAHQAFLVASIESRSRGDMIRYARANLIRALLVLGLSVVVAAVTGSAAFAFLLDALLTMAVAAQQMHKAFALVGRRGRTSALIAWRGLRRIPWPVAFQLAAVMALSFLVSNADRWVASARLAAAPFAAYAFAWTVLSLGQALQSLVNASVFPMLARRYGESGVGESFAICWRISLATLLAGAIAAVPLGWALDHAISRWYPQYVESLIVLPIFLAMAVLRLADFWSSFLMIAGKESALLLVQLLAALAATVGWVVMQRSESLGLGGMQAIAWLGLALTLGSQLAVALTAWRWRLP